MLNSDLGTISENGQSMSWARSLHIFSKVKVYWILIGVWMLFELLSYVLAGDSFFGILTGGVVETLKKSQGRMMTWHMFAGAVMWGLCCFQVLGKKFRHGPLAILHRMSGRIMLLLWFFIVGPSAAYLSLIVGIGKQNLHFFMTLFALAGMDAVVIASYYFFRALLLIRRGGSKDLHGRGMKVGMTFTMLITFQRPLQFFLIVIRKGIVLIAELMTLLLGTSAAEDFVTAVLDHHGILSVSTVIGGGWFLFIILDGPWSTVMYWLAGLEDGEDEELLGSKQPSFLELVFWRTRLPLYLVLRAWVTEGFSIDPEGLKLGIGGF